MAEGAGTAPRAGSDSVHAALRRDILRLVLAPGTRLDEGVLSARFAVSRTPVREALIRLAAEGLVSIARGQGARVAALDVRDLRGFFEALDLLARAVTRLAALRRTAAQLERIARLHAAFEAAAAARDSDAVNETNHEFHRAIAAAARNDYLAEAYGRCLGEGLRLSYVCFSDGGAPEPALAGHLAMTVQDHGCILAAIRRRDADAAEAAARRHAELFRSRVAQTVLSGGALRGLGPSAPD